jgi:hypothetical protein
MVILPSSFVGGPRYMQNLFQDAMSIVRVFGKPDFFITVTCNPKWPEIQNELKEGQSASDIPDIVSRIFRLKLKAILDMILNSHILGRCKAHMYTIEFQKRGLPHAHLLFIVNEEDKPRCIEDIDKIVQAEIPDPVTQPQLYETVTKCMNHGYCGQLFPDSPCMHNGLCSKKYPKQFQETTSNNNDGYPIYRRRNNGRTFVNGSGEEYDNRYIVPYNSVLSTAFDCHINVEICSSIQAIKYIYKYIYKGKIYYKNHFENCTTIILLM